MEWKLINVIYDSDDQEVVSRDEINDLKELELFIDIFLSMEWKLINVIYDSDDYVIFFTQEQEYVIFFTQEVEDDYEEDDDYEERKRKLIFPAKK
jgi:hypothetical protein